ncbi:unnamed protein product [Auanema sp. JU1783]|nr:unnamed protein product [Auanema sp. JU1783]
MNKTLVRNLIGFWLLGLCNNYGYVIMLSAAEDIMNNQKGVNSTTVDTCTANITSRGCTSASTGAVLLADNLPALFVQATFPFFMHRIPFGVRHTIVIALQIACYFLVAFSPSVAISLTGVTLASFSQGIGEITYLALSSFFPSSTIAAWSSGTGGAGLIGSFAYALMTDDHVGKMSPKTALLCMLFIPVVFAITYWFILDFPEDVYTPTLSPKTWLIPKNYLAQRMERSGSADEDGKDDDPSTSRPLCVPQRDLSLKEKLFLIVPLLKFMVPLALVYMGEYLINQGLTELIMFDCKNGFNLAVSSQYRWYQSLYQVGVFLSRSSVKVFELPMWAIYILPVLQMSNMIFFLFEAIYWFVPHISIVFVLIILEGLLGGSAYVNTYNKIHKMIEPDIREYSISITTLGNAIGTNIAGFLAIPLHNSVCKKPIHPYH